MGDRSSPKRTGSSDAAGGRHAAVYDIGGTLTEEPFGAYGLGDVDTALATLAAADGGTAGKRFPGRDDAMRLPLGHSPQGHQVPRRRGDTVRCV